MAAGTYSEDAYREALEAVCDPITIGRFTKIGMGAGWTCLEVSPGESGSIARWLAKRVGPEGRVVTAPVTSASFETAGHDLVHARCALSTLDDPRGALERLASAVKPGGTLFVEELDWSSLSAVDESDHRALDFNRLSRACHGALRAARVYDGSAGRRVQAMVEALGFERVSGDGVTQIGKGGEHPVGKLQRLHWTLGKMRRLVSAGILREEELGALVNACEDPGFSFIGFALYGAWGRKPLGK